MEEKQTSDKIQSCGVGGVIFSLITGLTGFNKNLLNCYIFPFLAPFTVFLFFIYPPLACMWIYNAIKRKGDMRRWFFLNFKAQLVIELIWILLLVIIYELISLRADYLFEIYKAQAMQNKTLQIATPEQMQYSQGLLQAYALSAAALIIGFIYLVSYGFANIDNRLKPFKQALRAMLLNLPGYLLIIVISITVFTIIERYFAILKLRYLEGYILNKEVFDPHLLFIVLRLYVLQALFTAYLLLSASSFCLIDLFTKRKKTR